MKGAYSVQVPDELRANRGNGRLSPTTEREFVELKDGAHPRQMMSPFGSMELGAEQLALAVDDEKRTCMCEMDTSVDATLDKAPSLKTKKPISEVPAGDLLDTSPTKIL